MSSLAQQLTEAEKETLSGKAFRLSWDRNGWTIEEVPQKGMRRVRHAEIGTPYGMESMHGRRAADAFMPENVMMHAKVTPNDSYDLVKTKIQSTMEAEWEKTGKEYWAKIRPWYEKSRGSVKFVPDGAGEIEAKGKDFVLSSSYDKFSVYSPGSTMQYHDGDPHYSGLVQKSSGAARKLYKILSKDPDQLAGMSYNEVGDWLRKNGIATEYTASSWS